MFSHFVSQFTRCRFRTFAFRILQASLAQPVGREEDDWVGNSLPFATGESAAFASSAFSIVVVVHRKRGTFEMRCANRRRRQSSFASRRCSYQGRRMTLEWRDSARRQPRTRTITLNHVQRSRTKRVGYAMNAVYRTSGIGQGTARPHPASQPMWLGLGQIPNRPTCC